MATRTAVAEAPLRMDILDRNAVEASTAKQVFTTVGTILTLVQASTLILRPPANSHDIPARTK